MKRKKWSKRTLIYDILIVLIILMMIGIWQYSRFKLNVNESIIKLDGHISKSPIVKIDEDIMSKTNNLFYNTGNPNEVWASNKVVPSDIELKGEYEKAKRVNNEVVGWIWIEGTNINYPIEYKKYDNNYYLHHNYRNDKWWNGAIFRESANTKWGNTDFINGHNMMNAVMFAQLMNFRIPQFYKNNKVIKVYDGISGAEYKIVGAFYVPEKHVFLYDIENPKERLAYYKRMQAKSIYGVEKVKDVKTIFLNTCLSNGTDNHLIIMAQKVG